MPFTTYIKKIIKGDGNCFYRCTSYYYRNSENYHLEFRNLLHEWMVENKDIFKDLLLEDQNSDKDLNYRRKHKYYTKKN